MTVGPKTFNGVVIILLSATMALLPIWPYSRWGYMPAIVLAIMAAMMFAFRRIARD